MIPQEVSSTITHLCLHHMSVNGIKKSLKKRHTMRPFEQAVQHSEAHGIPIAPEYVAHFNDLTGEEMKTLCQHINVENKTIHPSQIELVYRLNINVSVVYGEYTLYGDEVSSVAQHHPCRVKR